MNEKVIGVPDEPGWYFFKKDKKSVLSVVYINDDGVGTCLTEDGESCQLDDLVGRWELIEPENI